MTGAAGSSWKERREAMGKTLDQVSAELRIARRYLEGIEEGKFEGWPERVFSNGFIRTYARYLCQDPGPVLAEYERSIGERVENEMGAQLRPGWIERERERGSRRAAYAAAAGGVLLVGMLLAWVTFRAENRPLPPPTAVPAAPARPAPQAENAVKIQENVMATPASSVTGGSGAPAETPPDALPSGAGGAAVPPSVAVVGAVGPLSGPFQLFLEATEQTWLTYSFDDGAPVDLTLYPGDKISIQAAKQISLKLGNAGGVIGTLNGRRLPPFGGHGQVRKFTVGQ